MKTVGDLKGWLEKIDDNLPVQLMIETDNCQFEYPMNDVAIVTRKGIEQRYIIIMHEMFERKVNLTK